jgi:hypothetical protein
MLGSVCHTLALWLQKFLLPGSKYESLGMVLPCSDLDWFQTWIVVILCWSLPTNDMGGCLLSPPMDPLDGTLAFSFLFNGYSYCSSSFWDCAIGYSLRLHVVLSPFSLGTRSC